MHFADYLETQQDPFSKLVDIVNFYEFLIYPEEAIPTDILPDVLEATVQVRDELRRRRQEKFGTKAHYSPEEPEPVFEKSKPEDPWRDLGYQ